jgi:cyanophycinase
MHFRPVSSRFFLKQLVLVVHLFSSLTFSTSLLAQDGTNEKARRDLAAAPPEVEPAAVEPFDPTGTLILVGGGQVTDEIRQLIAHAGNAGQSKSCLVIIPTSSISADEEPAEYWSEPWSKSRFESIEILHTRDRKVADSDEFNEPLLRATAVWVPGGDQNRFAEVYAGTKTERRLQQMLERGGAVGGTSAGAAMASKIMIGGGNREPEMATGLDLLPYAIVDQHFANRGREQRLQKAVSLHPDRVGLGIDESTAAVFHRRTMRVVGEGKVHLFFPAGLSPAESRTITPETKGLDWTTMVHEGRERSRPPFPSAK